MNENWYLVLNVIGTGEKIVLEDFIANDGQAHTLNPGEVCDLGGVTGEYTKKHKDGWTIKARIVEDWFYWINDFEAVHPRYGRVYGNFENEVFADSLKGFKHFVKYHKPETWDYQDI